MGIFLHARPRPTHRNSEYLSPKTSKNRTDGVKSSLNTNNHININKTTTLKWQEQVDFLKTKVGPSIDCTSVDPGGAGDNFFKVVVCLLKCFEEEVKSQLVVQADDVHLEALDFRFRVCKFLAGQQPEYRLRITNFLSLDESEPTNNIDDYCKQMSRQGCYVTQPIIEATAEMIERPLHIYTSFSTELQPPCKINEDALLPPLLLGQIGVDHFIGFIQNSSPNLIIQQPRLSESEEDNVQTPSGFSPKWSEVDSSEGEPDNWSELDLFDRIGKPDNPKGTVVPHKKLPENAVSEKQKVSNWSALDSLEGTVKPHQKLPEHAGSEKQKVTFLTPPNIKFPTNGRHGQQGLYSSPVIETPFIGKLPLLPGFENGLPECLQISRNVYDTTMAITDITTAEHVEAYLGLLHNGLQDCDPLSGVSPAHEFNNGSTTNNYGGVRMNFYTHLFDFQCASNVVQKKFPDTGLVNNATTWNRGGTLHSTHKKKASKCLEQVLYGIRKVVRYILQFELFTAHDLYLPFGCIRVFFENPNLSVRFRNYLVSLKIKGSTICAIFKGLVRFVDHWTQQYNLFTHHVQRYLKQRYSVQDLIGLRKEFNSMALYVRGQQNRINRAQQSINLSLARGEFLMPEDLEALRVKAMAVLIKIGESKCILQRVDPASLDTAAIMDYYAVLDEQTMYRVRKRFDLKLSIDTYRAFLASVMLLVVLGSHGQRPSTIPGLYDIEVTFCGTWQNKRCIIDLLDRAKLSIASKGCRVVHRFEIDDRRAIFALQVYMLMKARASKKFRALVKEHCAMNPHNEAQTFVECVQSRDTETNRIIITPNPGIMTSGMFNRLIEDYYNNLDMLRLLDIQRVPVLKHLRKTLITESYIVWRYTKGYRGTCTYQRFIHATAAKCHTSVHELENTYILCRIDKTFLSSNDDVGQEFQHFPPPGQEPPIARAEQRFRTPSSYQKLKNVSSFEVSSLKSPEEFLGVVECPERPKLCITGTPGTSGKRKQETSSTETENKNKRKRIKKAKKKAKHRKKSKTKANKQATKPDDSSATIHYVNSAQPFSADEFNAAIHECINASGVGGLSDDYILDKLKTNIALAHRFAAADNGFGKQAHRVYNLAKLCCVTNVLPIYP